MINNCYCGICPAILDCINKGKWEDCKINMKITFYEEEVKKYQDDKHIKEIKNDKR